jgi:hypothetical protein
MVALLIVAALVGCAWGSSQQPPIWPQPSSIEVGNDALWLDRYLRVRVQCTNDGKTADLFEATSPSTVDYYAQQVKQMAIGTAAWLQKSLFGPANTSIPVGTGDAILEYDILYSATRQALWDLRTSSFVPWKFHKRHSRFQPESTHSDRKLSSITIMQAICPESGTSAHVFHKGDETYSLVAKEQTVTIETQTTVGTLRALGSYFQSLLLFFSRTHV